jgi:hypothetical protein
MTKKNKVGRPKSQLTEVVFARFSIAEKEALAKTKLSTIAAEVRARCFPQKE